MQCTFVKFHEVESLTGHTWILIVGPIELFYPILYPILLYWHAEGWMLQFEESEALKTFS